MKPILEAITIKENGKHHPALRFSRKDRPYNTIYISPLSFDDKQEAQKLSEGWRRESDESGYVTGVDYRIFPDLSNVKKEASNETK